MKQSLAPFPRKLLAASLTAALVILCAVSPSCSSRPRGEERRYDLKGRIVSVDKAKGEVIVDHEEVPGYMPPMRMPFPVKDADVLATMGAGDALQATLVVADSGYWLENVAITKGLPGGDAAAAGGLEPKPGDELPDITLVNQDGAREPLRRLRGSALLVTFIYTRCPLPDQCPLMSTNFAEINRRLAGDEALRSKTRLLSVTLDPEFDRPEVLRDYAARYAEGQFDRWEFLTGDPEEIKRLATFFGLMYKADGGQIIHSLRTALVGPDGRLYKIYRGNEWKPEEVLRDLHGLIQRG